VKPVPSILAAPWAIEPEWLRVAFAVWSRGALEQGALAEARAAWQARLAAEPKAEEPGGAVEGTGGTLRIIGDVGVISIVGPLFRHANLFSEFSGGTTYDAIWRGLEAAEKSSAVRAILLRVNSPGGEADGCNELAKGIRAAGERKLIWTYGDNMVASAAFWLASQTARRIVEQTTEVGSIGVRCGLVDDSAHDEMHGIRQIEIVSSVSPGKRNTPIDDEVIGRLQVRIDDLAAVFVEEVAIGMAVSVEKVVSDFGRGDVMIASKALDAGLIDEIGDFNSTLAALSRAALNPVAEEAHAPRPKRGVNMSGKQQQPKVEAGDEADAKHCAGCNEPMHPDADAYCKHCYEGEHDEPDGDEDTDADAEAKGLKAAGLLGAKRSETRVMLAVFARSVLKQLGAATADEALGKAKAGSEAIVELQQARQAAATAEATKAKATVIGTIKGAVEQKKIVIGALSGLVEDDSFIDEPAAGTVRTALSTAPATLAGAVAAFEAANYTARDARRISAYFAIKGAALPSAHRPAPEDEANLRATAAPTAGARKGYSIADAEKNAKAATQGDRR
jgi:ClpP class serine protease